MSKSSGLAQALSVVADDLKQQRQAGLEMGQKQNILGMEEASKGRLLEKEYGLKPKEPIEWKPTTQQEAIDFEKAKKGRIIKMIDKMPYEYNFDTNSFEPLEIGGLEGEEVSKEPSSVGMFNPLRMLPGFAYKGKLPQKVKQLDSATAQQILQEAGGDKDKAREIAKSRGYSF